MQGIRFRGTRRALTGFFAAVVATGGLLALDVAAAGAAPITSPGPLTQVGVGTNLNCSANHTLNDDPIVYPGQAGASHNHTFLGNTTTNAATTLKTLDKNTDGFITEDEAKPAPAGRGRG